MTIIQKFVVLAVLLGCLGLFSPVESNADMEQNRVCCSTCQFSGMGTPQCEVCLETC